MIAAYAALGVDPVEAVAGTLLFRGLRYLVILALGLPSLAFHELAAGPDAGQGSRSARSRTALSARRARREISSRSRPASRPSSTTGRPPTKT